MKTLLAVDPGNRESGWCLLDGRRVVDCGKVENQKMLNMVHITMADTLAIEMIEGRGMPVGRDVFETCVWIGRFIQAWRYCDDVKLVYRRDVKLFLCGTNQAKDANVRQAIIDRYEATGGGKTPQIGTKAQPGPLYGMAGDAWAALGVGLTVLGENHGTRTID